MDSRVITRLMVRGYKSIAACDFELGALTLLVGRNGAGKSNLLDALRLVRDSLRNTPSGAIDRRGGFENVACRNGTAAPRAIAIDLDLVSTAGNDAKAKYSFELRDSLDGVFVANEACDVFDSAGTRVHGFLREGQRIVTWTPQSVHPATHSDRLFLVSASGLPEFSPIYDDLNRMAFFNFVPDVMRSPQPVGSRAELAHDGRNIARVIRVLANETQAQPLDRITQFLRAIGVPIQRIVARQVSGHDTLHFYTEGNPSNSPPFDALVMSDGTMRALGILIAALGNSQSESFGKSVIGIEEPEAALHPAAAAVMMDALLEGSESRQIIVTCHSPDFLDHPNLTTDMIRPVLMENGRTVVGRLSPAKAESLRKHLFTAGELLRMDQLDPVPDDTRRQNSAAPDDPMGTRT